MRYAFVVFSILFLLLSCNDSGTDPEEKLFTLTYEVESPRDSSVTAIELETITYYPEEDISWYQLRNYQDDDFDMRLMIQAPEEVYLGCTRELQINVSKYWDQADIFPSFRRYRFKKDTISSFNDSLLYVRFPEDTMKATRVNF